MAQKFMHYNIVVSCPSDMVGDREKLQNAVAIVNEQNAHFRQMHFDIKYWQKDVLFGVGDPQLIINNSIIKMLTWLLLFLEVDWELLLPGRLLVR